MIHHKVMTKVEDKDLQDLIWQQYKESFLPLRELTAQDQECYTKEQFVASLTDEDYLKYLLYDDDRLIGFGNLSANLEKAAKQAYANPVMIKAALAKEYSEGQMFYFNGLYLIPEYRKRKEVWFALIGPMFSHVDSHQGVAVFDHSLNANPKLEENLLFVAQTMQKMGNTQTTHASAVRFDCQAYAAIKLR